MLVKYCANSPEQASLLSNLGEPLKRYIGITCLNDFMKVIFRLALGLMLVAFLFKEIPDLLDQAKEQLRVSIRTLDVLSSCLAKLNIRTSSHEQLLSLSPLKPACVNFQQFSRSTKRLSGLSSGIISAMLLLRYSPAGASSFE